MKTNSEAERIAHKMKHPKKPTSYWVAIDKYTGLAIKTGEIKFLRAELGDSCNYKPKS